MSNCLGCGIKLQTENKNLPGYIQNIETLLCNRCFNIKNYNSKEESNSILSNEKLLEKINSFNKFTFFLCDITGLTNDNLVLFNKITNPKIFILTKVDILPKNLVFQKLKENISKVYQIRDIIFFSKENGYGTKEILKLISKEKNVLFTGPTSAGKSSLLNYLFDFNLTVSDNFNTTQDFNCLVKDDLQIIDAPGFENASKIYKLKGKIKPKTLLLKTEFMLVIDNQKLAFDKDINLTLFLVNNVKALTKKKDNSLKNETNILQKSDIILFEKGFIYISSENINIYHDGKVFIRPSIVSGDKNE